MNNTKKTLITGAVMLVAAVPLLTFASGGMKGIQGHFVAKSASGTVSTMEGRGHFGPKSGSGMIFAIPANVQTALTASGIAIPTTDEMKAHRDAMQKVDEAMKNLSESDKAALQAMRAAAQKAERDLLRTKWVPLPSESEIAKFETLNQKMHELMQNGNGGKMKGGRGMEGGEFGGRGMMGR